jgi:hypothetical protein
LDALWVERVRCEGNIEFAWSFEVETRGKDKSQMGVVIRQGWWWWVAPLVAH